MNHRNLIYILCGACFLFGCVAGDVPRLMALSDHGSRVYKGSDYSSRSKFALITNGRSLDKYDRDDMDKAARLLLYNETDFYEICGDKFTITNIIYSESAIITIRITCIR